MRTPEGQGLLAATFGGLASAGRGGTLNTIGRAGIAGLGGYSSALEAQEARQYTEAKLREARLKQDRERQKLEALPTFFGDGKINHLAGLQAGYTPSDLKAMAELPNAGRSKVARTIKGVENGREVEYQVDDFGQRVGDGMAQYRAPLEVALGDKKSFLDPFSLGKVADFNVGQSPDSRASVAATMRGQNMTDARARERLAVDQTAAQSRGGGNVRTGPMSVTLQKELLESDDAIQSAGSIIRSLQTAKEQNEKAYGGYFAKKRAQIVSNLGGSEAADSTIDIDNLMTGQGLDQLKAIFGAAPTEGERKILMDMQASVDKTPRQREAIMDRAVAAAERRAAFAKSKAQAIRDGSYLTEGVRLPEQESKPVEKKVVKTGTYGGKKVIQYSDGSVEYAN